MKNNKFTIYSPAFEHEGTIPQKYTCEGEDISPALNWKGAPAGTNSFALISDDPDAPAGIWVHWVIYNIPPTSTGLAEGVGSTKKVLDDGSMQGINTWPKLGYGGPCPPSGTHRYYFKLYALDTKLNLKPGATKDELLKAMQGHVLGEAVLMGKYKLRKR